MDTYRVEATLTEDGTLTLTNLPFQAGKSVEVIIIERSAVPGEEDRYPLRGTPIQYKKPTDPVALDDWDVWR